MMSVRSLRPILATVASVALLLGAVASGAPRAEAAPPQAFTPFGLTNGFGTDAQTQRVVSWLAQNSAGYTSPYIKASTDPDAVADADPTFCTSATLAYPMTAYTAYTCTLTGLDPGTTYTYLVGASAKTTGVESPPYTFTTDAASPSSFTFLDFADTQALDVTHYGDYWGNDLTTALQRNPQAAFVMQAGDLTDVTDTPSVVNWLSAIGTSLSDVGFNVVLGNHDDGISSMWANAFPRASLTSSAAYGADFPLQYSFVYGNALFLNVNTNFTSSAQLNATSDWVKATVAQYGTNPDGSRRFVIVSEHKSPFGGIHSGPAGTYPSGDMGNPDILKVLPKTYYEAGVDLVLAGHDHNLLRSLPITWNYDTKLAQWDRSKLGLDTIDAATDGLVYFIPSFAGQKNYGPVVTSATAAPWLDVSKNYAVAPENDAYSTVTVDATSIHVDTYTVKSTTPVDSFVITHTVPAVSLTTPAIAGDATVGATLTAQATATPDTASLSYEWFSNGVSVQGPSASNTYAVQPSDAGNDITVTVTATASGMTPASDTSDPVRAQLPVSAPLLEFSVWPLADLSDQSTWVEAGGSYTLVMTPLDGQRNPVQAPDITVTPSSSDVSVGDVTDDGNGNLSVTLTATKASADYTVTASAPGFAPYAPQANGVWSLPIPFKAGPVCSPTGDDVFTGSVAKPTLTVGEATVMTVELVDSCDRPVSGATVAFKGIGDADVSETWPGSFVTNAQGVATATITDTTAETVTVSATTPTASYTVSAPVTFNAGDPAVSGFECKAGQESTNVSAAQSVVTVSSTTTIRAWVTDKYCNPLDGTDVQLTATGGGVSPAVWSDSGSPDLTATTVNGVITSNLGSSVQQSVTVTASTDIGGVATQLPTVPASGLVVSFQTSCYQHDSTFTVTPAVSMSDPSTWPLAGVSGYTGTVAAWGQVYSGCDDGPMLNLDPSDVIFTPSSPDVQVSAVTNNHDGTYSAQFTSLLANADFTVTATLALPGLTPVTVGSPLPIPFTAQPPLPMPGLELSVSPLVDLSDQSTWVEAGNSYTLTMTPRGMAAQASDITVMASSSDVSVGDVTANGDGTFSVTLTGTNMGGGDYTVTASAPGFVPYTLQGDGSLPLPIPFVPIPPVPVVLHAELTVSHAPVTGGDEVTGGQAVTATVAVTDSLDNPVPGVEVTFDPGNGTTTSTMRTTDENGVASVVLTAPSASCTALVTWGISATASLNGLDVPVDGSPLNLTVVPAQDACRPGLELSVSPLADLTDQSTWVEAGKSYTLTITPKGMAAQASAITVTASSSDVSVGDVTDNGDGTFSVTLTSGKISGDYTVIATAPGFLPYTLQGSGLPLPIPFGPPTLPPCSPTGDDVFTGSVSEPTLTVGNSTVMTLQLLNSCGAPVSGATVAFKTIGPVELAETAPGSFVTDDQGVATATISSTTAGTVTVSATTASSSTTVSVPVTFNAGDPADPAGTSCDTGQEPTNVSVGQNPVSVGTPVTVRVYVTDKYCNPLDGVHVQLTATGIAADAVTWNGSRVSNLTLTTVNGVATADLGSLAAQQVTVEALVDIGGVATPLSPRPYNGLVVAFQACSVQGSTFTVTPVANVSYDSTWVPADGVSSYTGTVAAMDLGPGGCTAVPITDLDPSDVVFTPSSPDVQVSAVTNNHDGTYSAQFTSQVAGADFTVSAAAVVDGSMTTIGGSLPIPFKTEPLVTPGLELSVSPLADLSDQSTWLEVGHYYTLTMTPQGTGVQASDITVTASSPDVLVGDVTDNGDGSFSVTLTSGKISGDYTVTASAPGFETYTLQASGGSSLPIPFRPIFSPPLLWNAQLTVYHGPGTGGDTVTGGQAVTATVTVVDSYGNPVPGVEVTFDPGNGTTTSKMRTTDDNGVASVTATAPPAVCDTAVTWSISATVNVNGTDVAVDGSPATLSVVPLVGSCPTPGFSARLSTFTVAAGASDTGQICNRVPISYTGTLVAVDGNDNLMTGLDTSKMVFTPSSPNVVVSDVTDEGGGVYKVTFTDPALSAAHLGDSGTVSVTYDGSDKVSDGNGATDLSIPFTMMCAVPPPTASASLSYNAATQTATVLVVDQGSNPVVGASVTFDAGNGPATVQTNSQGIASVSVTPPDYVCDTVVSWGISASVVDVPGVTGPYAPVANSPLSLTVVPPAGACVTPPATFSADKSTFTVTTAPDPDSWGCFPLPSGYTGTLTARDSDGNPMAGLDTSKMQFAVSSSDRMTVSTPVDQGDGTYTVTFTPAGSSLDTGGMGLTASVTYDSSAKVSDGNGITDLPVPYSVMCIDPPLQGPFPNLAYDPSTHTATVDVMNYQWVGTPRTGSMQGTPVPDVAVTFTVTGATIGGATQSIVTTNDQGIASVTVTPPDFVCGSVVPWSISASADTTGVWGMTSDPSQRAENSPLDLTVTAPPGACVTPPATFSVDKSTFAVTAGPTRDSWGCLPVPYSYTGTLTARDSDGNPMAGLDTSKMQFTVSSSDLMTVSTPVDNGDGTYTVTFTPAFSGSGPGIAATSLTASVTYDGSAKVADGNGITDLPVPYGVRCTDPPPQTFTSTLAYDPATQTATVSAVSQQWVGTPLTGSWQSGPLAGTDVTFSVVGATIDGTTPSTVTTNDAGIASVKVTPPGYVCGTTVTWSISATAKFGGADVPVGGSPQTLTVMPPAGACTVPTLDRTNGSLITGTATPGDTITVSFGDGTPVTGCESVKVDDAGHFSCTPSTPVSAGTSLVVTETTAGGTTSTTGKVESLGLAVGTMSVTVGNQETITGSNFNPGEQVHLVLQSTPVDMGYQTADAQGTVVFRFTVPSSLEAGQHTATLTGAQSGSIQGTFQVASQAAAPSSTQSTIQVATGGTPAPTTWVMSAAVGTGVLGLVLLWFALAANRRTKIPLRRRGGGEA